MCARISSSGSFSSACRLISSISRRCRRTLASSSLSLSSVLVWAAWLTGSDAGSGKTVQDTPSSAGDGSSAGTNSGAAARLVVKRPTILVTYRAEFYRAQPSSRPRELELLADPGGLRGRGLGRRLRQDQPL